DFHVTGVQTCALPILPDDALGVAARAAAAEFYTLSADYRRYYRTSLRSAYALRVYGFFSNGAIPARTALGGSHRLRGYPRHSLAASCAVLLNQECRFTLSRALGVRVMSLG